MKKSLIFLMILSLGLSLYFSSCVKDTFTESDAYSAQKNLTSFEDSLKRSNALLLDSLRHTGGLINYSVAAVLASDASWKNIYGGSKGANDLQLDQTTISVSQYGVVQTVTTDASGIATFKNLRIGTVNVNIRKSGITEVDLIAMLPPLPDTVTRDAYDIVRNVGTMVPVFSLTANLATISGIATIETDLTNDAPEVAANAEIFGTIDVDNEAFMRYLYQPGGDYPNINKAWYFDYYGSIKQIAFHSTISKATSGTDGSFSLKVPSTPDGLPIKLFASQLAATQKLLQPTVNNVPVWGVQSVRTIFGPTEEDFSYSSVPALGTLYPWQVQSAYVQFSAPTGSVAAQPTVTASATAVLSSTGIVSVNITNPGQGYTQPPKVTFGPGTGFNPVQAEGTAVVSNGRVSGVTITSAGSGYSPYDVPDVTFTEGIERQAEYDAEFSFSVVDIDVTNYGSGYSQTPPNVTILGSGTGATGHAVMAAYIKSIDITSPGSGYTQAPQIIISDNFKAYDGAVPVMTTNNPLFSIDYNGLNATLWPSSPLPSATIVGTGGTGATANVTLSTAGKVTGFTTLVGGSGYTSAPTITITGGGGFGARATATVVAGAVTNITINDQGQGYTSVPTFTFTGGAGTGASATAVLGFPVQSITLNAPGVGYSALTAINVSNGGPNTNYLPNCVVKFNMGLRSISLFDNGFYYSGVPTITINPKDGNGSGAAATAAIQWEIKDVVVDNQGSGYKFNNQNNLIVKIDAPSGAGTQATATAILGNGRLSAVGLVTLGEGYTAAPNVYVAISTGGESTYLPPTRQAKLTATVSGGHVTGLTITDPGEGYDFFSYADGGYYIDISTYDVAAAATAQANPKSGQIDFIQIDNPGAGYAVAPSVEIVNQDNSGEGNGFGKGATATAVVTDGRISAINLTNAGSGYYVVPNIRITVPSSLVKAVGMCLVNETDGRITGVYFPGWKPYTNGFGYASAPTVTFTPSVPGKGSGATGVAVIQDGQVVDVIMTNQGSGYLGRNNPTSSIDFTVTPQNYNPIIVTAGKTYIRDLYFGTGKRMTEEDYSWFE